MSTPRVTVAISAHNRAHYIVETLESVFAQTYRDYEVVLIDNGSTDNLLEVIEPYRSRLRLIQQEDRGAPGGRQAGLDHARGQYINFFDSDDIMYPDKLEHQVAFLDAHPDIDLVQSGYDLIDADGVYLKSVEPWHDAPNWDLKSFLLWPSVLLQSCLMHTSVARKVDGFDLTMTHCDDTDIMHRIMLAGCRAAWLKKQAFMYRKHPASLTANIPISVAQLMEVRKQSLESDSLPEDLTNLREMILMYTLFWGIWQMHIREYSPATIARYIQQLRVWRKHLPDVNFIALFVYSSASYAIEEPFPMRLVTALWKNLKPAVTLTDSSQEHLDYLHRIWISACLLCFADLGEQVDDEAFTYFQQNGYAEFMEAFRRMCYMGLIRRSPKGVHSLWEVLVHYAKLPPRVYLQMARLDLLLLGKAFLKGEIGYALTLLSHLLKLIPTLLRAVIQRPTSQSAV